MATLDTWPSYSELSMHKETHLSLFAKNAWSP